MEQEELDIQVDKGSEAEDPKKYVSLKYLLISISLSILGMVIVFYYTYTPGLFDNVSMKRLPGLGIAVVVSFLRVWFSAAKIRFLADKEIDWLAAFRIILVWDFTSAITPSSIGGAPMATYAMSKENIKLGKSTAIILYALLLDMILFALLVPVLVIGGFYYKVIPNNIGWVGEGVMFIIYACLLVYAILTSYAIFVNPRIMRRLITWIFKIRFLRKHRARAEKEAHLLEETSRELKTRPISFLLKAFSMSTLSWLARIWLPTIIVLSFMPADVMLSFLRSVAMNLAGLFMPTPGGSGGMEGLFALFQGPLMASRAYFIGISVFLWRLISYYITIGLGMMATTWYVKRTVDDNFLDKNNGDGGMDDGVGSGKSQKAHLSV
ncbi:MAG TPA: lysylphosphatidylglycerol synthase transmembrane domain-containing protein [Balneolales bacterium]|nr:lysylphosphatidylglycerol synthase transmembrane domain-containing protein [Balneolales bacterium]